MIGGLKTDITHREEWLDLSLPKKIDHSLGVIEKALNITEGKIVISYSGGKDSEVLLHLARIIKPDIHWVYVNTGMEYPEIVYWVRERLKREPELGDIIHPKVKAQEIIAKRGFPLISKQVSLDISNARSTGRVSSYIPSYALPLLTKKYSISPSCCYYLKKKPLIHYMKDKGINGTLVGLKATDSRRRLESWKIKGCIFTDKYSHIKANPLSIWRNEDVLKYIKDNHIDLCPIYECMDSTGCCFCGFMINYWSTNFQKSFKFLKEHHPKLFYHFLNNFKNNGVPYKEAYVDAHLYSGKINDIIL